MKWPPWDQSIEKRCFILIVLWSKFADLQAEDWNTKEICGFAVFGLNVKNSGFAICGLAHIGNLRNCDSGKSDMR
jgi:hypothetical protein